MTEVNCECLLPTSDCGCDTEPAEGQLPKHPASWHLDKKSAAIPAVCPTNAEFTHPEGLKIVWNSRSHRKGRCPKLLAPDGRKLAFSRPPLVLLNLDLRNPSWWIGFLFTVGSALWIIHGAMIMVLEKTETEYYVQSWSALIGIFLFIIGAYMATLEALNAELSVKLSYVLVKDDPEAPQCGCNWTARAVSTKRFHGVASLRKKQDDIEVEKSKYNQYEAKKRKYRFWGWEPDNLGFISNFMVFFASSFFAIPVIVGYHSIAEQLSTTMIDVFFWTPQVLASILFVVAPVLGMLEMQDKWWKIKPTDLGWLSAFFNFIGGWGFLICGVLGYWAEDEGILKWGVGFSTLWGSVAFLLGSAIVWFEVMNPFDATL